MQASFCHTYMCAVTAKTFTCACTPKVHSMHLGPKISSVELAFSSAWWHGYSLNYNLWRMGTIKSKSPHMVLLIFAPQVYTNLHLWRTPEMLMAYLQREVYTKCTLDVHIHPYPCTNLPSKIKISHRHLPYFSVWATMLVNIT